MSRDFAVRDQIRESAGATAPLIAEGFSRGGPVEFARYLKMAVGELSETRTHLDKGCVRGYWTSEQKVALYRLCDRALDMTRKLLAAKLRQVEAQKKRDRAARSRRKPDNH